MAAQAGPLMPSLGDIALSLACLVVLVWTWAALWRCDHQWGHVSIIERLPDGERRVRHVERCQLCPAERDAEGRPC